jgi:hypothetical protein
MQQLTTHEIEQVSGASLSLQVAFDVSRIFGYWVDAPMPNNPQPWQGVAIPG